MLDGEMPQYIADNNSSSVDITWWVYTSLSQKVTSAEVLKVTINLGASEKCTFGFRTIRAGNAPALTDDGITFLDLIKTSGRPCRPT